jgi:hypothetical protein
MTLSTLVFVYLFSIVFGHIVTWIAIRLLRIGLKHWAKRNHQRLNWKTTDSVWWLSALVGMFERAVVTTLVIWVPSLTATFIGAWVLLKFAGGWGRFKESSLHIRSIHMCALIGNVLSFACAIGAGLYAMPKSLDAFTK